MIFVINIPNSRVLKKRWILGTYSSSGGFLRFLTTFHAACVLGCRYKRGRAFYSEGRCSDPTNDRREGFSSDLPSHHCNALIWIEEYLADLRKQRRLFRSEMTKLQSSPMSPQPTSPTTTRTRTKISKSIVETITQSPPKLSSATNFRKRRRGKAILEV